MIVNDELYLSRYKVVSIGLDYDDDTECIILDDYDKVTATDKLSELFNDNKYITNVKLIDLTEAVLTNDLDTVYTLVSKLCHANYWRGYDDGFKA